jgi:hypothetical protein
MGDPMKIFLVIGYGYNDSKLLCVVGAADVANALRLAYILTNNRVVFKEEDVKTLPGNYDGIGQIFGFYDIA